VQVAEYVGGRKQRIIAHLGSAHTEAELGILLQQARTLLEDDRQEALDLGLEPAPPQAALLPARPAPAVVPRPPGNCILNAHVKCGEV
jgi:phosphoglycolate phosphatase-like HAD superfamily hydrolase